LKYCSWCNSSGADCRPAHSPRRCRRGLRAPESRPDS
jgi:hypothetical protein